MLIWYVHLTFVWTSLHCRLSLLSHWTDSWLPAPMILGLLVSVERPNSRTKAALGGQQFKYMNSISLITYPRPLRACSAPSLACQVVSLFSASVLPTKGTLSSSRTASSMNIPNPTLIPFTRRISSHWARIGSWPPYWWSTSQHSRQSFVQMLWHTQWCRSLGESCFHNEGNGSTRLSTIFVSLYFFQNYLDSVASWCNSSWLLIFWMPYSVKFPSFFSYQLMSWFPRSY